MNKVYEIVQEKILDRLEKAIKNDENFDWIKPWVGGNIPTNFVTKKPYRGINLLLLEKNGYYMTFDQIKKKNGRIKKGAKSNIVVYWNFQQVDKNDLSKEEKDVIDSVSDNKGETKYKTKVLFRYYKVFHESDIEGIDFGNTQKDNDFRDFNKDAYELLDTYSEKVVPINKIKGFDKACYNKRTDQIFVPSEEQFTNLTSYYSVTFHEIIHSTGHHSRLNRLENCSFGDEDYSTEELIAEIGSSLLRAYCGIENQKQDNNSIAYLKGWFEAIKNEKPHLIACCAQKAQKAVEYIFDSISFTMN